MRVTNIELSSARTDREETLNCASKVKGIKDDEGKGLWSGVSKVQGIKDDEGKGLWSGVSKVKGIKDDEGKGLWSGVSKVQGIKDDEGKEFTKIQMKMLTWRPVLIINVR